MPHSVEMPAPVKGTMRPPRRSCCRALRRRCADPVRSLQDIRRFHTDYSTASRITRPCQAALATGSFGSRASSVFLTLATGAPSDFFTGLPYWASFSSSASSSARRGDLLEQSVGGEFAQGGEFFDAQRIQIDLGHWNLPFSVRYREGAQATSSAPALSTALVFQVPWLCKQTTTIPQTCFPIHAPISTANSGWDDSIKRMGNERTGRQARA